MRLTFAAFGPAVLLLALGAAPQSAAAKATAQSAHCAQSAKRAGLSGAQGAAFIKTCMKGPLTPKTPTGPTARSKESQAVTKPSGVDRTTRTKQCANEADRKGLSDKDRRAFQLSCLATAGPVQEGETGTVMPRPANQIQGIGVNNYKPSDTTAKSKPATSGSAPGDKPGSPQ